MTDLAELGFRVDTAALAQGNAALDSFESKANQVAGSLNKLSAAGNEQKTVSGQYASTLDKVGVANDNVAGKVGLARQQFGLINSSMRAAFDTAIYGVTPMQELALVTERLALSAGEEGAGAVFSRLKATLASVLTPMNLLIGGSVLATASAVLLYQAWKDAALQLDNAARAAGITTQAMSGLSQAAAIKGVGSGDFFDSMQKFALNVNDAQHNMGTLGALLRANGQSARTFQDYFDRIADLVHNATTDIQRQQILLAAGLPATAESVRYWSQGAAGIHAAAESATKLGGTVQDELIARSREFDENWAKSWNNFKIGAENAIVGVKAKLDEMSKSKAPDWLIKLLNFGNGGIYVDEFGNGTAYGANKLPANPVIPVTRGPDLASPGGNSPLTDAQRVKQLQDLQAQINLLGELASADDLVRAKEAELGIQWIQNKIGVGGLHDALMNLIRAQKDMADVNAQAQIGVFDLDRVQKAYGETLQGQIDKKLLDPTNVNQMTAANTAYAKAIDNLSRSAEIAGSRFEQLTALSIDAANPFKQLDTAGTQVANSMGQAFTDIVTGAKSAGQAFKDLERSVITAIANMIAQMLIVAPIALMLRNILTGFFGGTPGIPYEATGNPFASAGGTTATNAPSPSPQLRNNYTLSSAANSNNIGGRPIQVFINEAPNTQTQTRTRQQGGVDILEITTKHAFDKLAQGKGNAAMGAAYNAQPALTPR